MVNYSVSLTLLNRQATNVTASPKLPVAVTGTTVGDLNPWRIRMELTNCGVGKINNGSIKLRIDEHKTFIRERSVGGITTPILVDESAKNNFLIDAQLSQTDSSGNTVYGKKFRFQIGSVDISIDQQHGSILTIQLTEIQYRLKETLSSYRHWFQSADDNLGARCNEFNNAQLSGSDGKGVTIVGLDGIDLPTEPKTHYLPNSPQTIHELMQETVGKLAKAVVIGGTFVDHYFDFTAHNTLTNSMSIEAKEEGKYPASGTGYNYSVPVINPASVEAFSVGGEESQSAVSDSNQFKNNVIVKGGSQAGSLPMEHARFGSELEHGKQRDEWNSSTTYKTGDKVKKTFTVSSVNEKVIRFFELTKVTSATSTTPSLATTHQSSTSPDQDHTNWKEDFTIIPEWKDDGGGKHYGRYFKDEIVYYNDSGTIKFFKANKQGTIENIGDTSGIDFSLVDCDVVNPKTVSTDKPTASSDWTSISSDVPNRSATNYNHFYSYNPWNMPDDWRKNLAGLESGSLPNQANRYIGLAYDWNFARDTYGVSDFTNDWERINIKWVSRKDVADPTNTTKVPNGSIWHGQRFLVSSSPTSGKPFAGQGNKIAEFDNSSKTWKFSKSPSTGESITNLEDGKVYKWSGSAWVISCDVQTMADRHGQPFHLVKNIYKTTGASGIPSQAIEWRYHWYVPMEAQGDFSFLGDTAQLSSRGVWCNFWFPFPKQATAHGGIGHQIGGDGMKYNGSNLQSNTGGTENWTSLNVYNTNSDRLGNVAGWNNGLNSEDMGKISALQFRIKVEFSRDYSNMNWGSNSGVGGTYTSSQRECARPFAINERITGIANIPMVFWAIDSFDRIWFHRFKLRRNGEYDLITIPFSDLNTTSSDSLYFARWDELTKVFGYTIGGLNFMLKEKEFTGVKFDWRFVRGCGIMWEGSYQENGFYAGGTNTWWDYIEQGFKQAGASVWNILVEIHDAIVSAGTQSDGDSYLELNKDKESNHANFLIRQTSIALDDFHFVKELYVNSDDTALDRGRTEVETYSDVDYLNCKQYARSRKARLSFFPQQWHIRALGNVKIRLGHKFKVKGDRVPLNTADVDEQELICHEVKHIIDHSGYHMEINGHRKFDITEPEINSGNPL
tara:strand:+ start:1523 stop:4888 length:3366 start_codon:yes stop_codon:yes gene_type:complete